MKKNLLHSLTGNYYGIQNNRYGTPEEEAAAAAVAAAAAETTKREEEAKRVAAAGGGGNDDLARLKFTPEQQDFFNRRLAEEKRAMQQQNTKTIDELKKVQQQSSTTEQQRKELQTRIEELQRQHMSKEEIAKQEQEQKMKEWHQSLQTEKKRGDDWEKRYHESTITRSLLDGAVVQDAFSPQQIVDMLYSKTRLVPELDSDNKETGNFVPRIHLQDTDKDGRVVTLDLTVQEALQKMKNTPERYGNLFKSTLAGGLGQNGNVNGTRSKGKSAKDYTPAEWAAAREKDPNFSFVETK